MATILLINRISRCYQLLIKRKLWLFLDNAKKKHIGSLICVFAISGRIAGWKIVHLISCHTDISFRLICRTYFSWTVLAVILWWKNSILITNQNYVSWNLKYYLSAYCRCHKIISKAIKHWKRRSFYLEPFLLQGS